MKPNYLFFSHFFQAWRSRLVWLPESINPTDVRLVHAHPSGNLYPKRVAFLSQRTLRKNQDLMKTSFQPVLMGMLSYLEKCTNQPRILSSIFLICVHMETLEIECISKSIFEIWCKIPRNSEAMPPCLFVACLKSKQNPLDQLSRISCRESGSSERFKKYSTKFLSDPGISGVRSMGPSVSNSLTHTPCWNFIQVIDSIQVIQVMDSIQAFQPPKIISSSTNLIYFDQAHYTMGMGCRLFWALLLFVGNIL